MNEKKRQPRHHKIGGLPPIGPPVSAYGSDPAGKKKIPNDGAVLNAQQAAADRAMFGYGGDNSRQGQGLNNTPFPPQHGSGPSIAPLPNAPPMMPAASPPMPMDAGPPRIMPPAAPPPMQPPPLAKGDRLPMAPSPPPGPDSFGNTPPPPTPDQMGAAKAEMTPMLKFYQEAAPWSVPEIINNTPGALGSALTELLGIKGAKGAPVSPPPVQPAQGAPQGGGNPLVDALMQMIMGGQQ